MISGKRAFDVAVSTIAFAIVSPLFLLIALAILLEDGTPIIFRQRRVGKGGSPFWIYKFRKLKHRPHESAPLVVTPEDERYTTIGRFLDASKLNELPQLLNIMKGDMSLVGPRPEIPEFLHCYHGAYRNLLRYPPGIFGPSQTVFRNETEMYPVGIDKSRFYEVSLFKRKAELDLQYYCRATLASDLYWVVRSLMAVVLEWSQERPAVRADWHMN